jgi:UDP:flavonoid glycosyltransferase YjiC (YdhE family)
MSHIGLVTPAYTGHVNPMITLGHELQARGHQVTLIATPDAREDCERDGIAFVPIGAAEFPPGALEAFTDKQGTLTGVPAIRFIMKDLVAIAAVQSRELLGAVTAHGIDALVIDQILPMGSVIAEKLDIPYVTLCSLLPLNTDVSVPPFMMPWPYAQTVKSRIQNTIGYRVQEIIERPLRILTNKQRAAWGMKASTVDGTFSDLAQIAQIPTSLDYPRKNAPACFHNTAPLHDFDWVEEVPFPWEALDGRPLIYASMGTLQNRLKGIFATIAEACADLDAQLVISLGHRGAPIPTHFPGNPIVVDYAPQLDLLKRASLHIGHGGLNTVLQTLACGLPMVLLPAATDQPGVAARVKHLGAAEFIPVRKATPAKLRAAIHTIQTNPTYRANAQNYQNQAKNVNGVHHSADIIEQAFTTRQPVLRTAIHA